MAKKALGKGIDALLGAIDKEDNSGLTEIDIDELVANKEQPRKHFDDSSLEELASSIKEKGVLQPILVEELPEGRYRIVAGERRYRAAKIAGLEKVPVIIRSFTEQERLEIALIENIQREDLSPIEEALAYKDLMNHASITQDELAKRLGKSRPAIANALRLLQLPEKMQKALEEKKISPGHARAILSVVNPAAMEKLYQRIIAEGLSVREAERLAAELNSGRLQKSKTDTVEPSRTNDPFLRQLEEKCIEKFGTKVRIKGSLKRGTLQIDYYSADDLTRIIDLLIK
ncbi:ParB/RepB/Spo0J family partition protein [Spirochaetia bacterium 38H-sp]|uniref:ParB/RepB/Spo0J family partition protein n=1 Tax=Rarispira pelagica TaxID=3141764 RepID=A0ABU9U9S4_9SPIR